MTLKDNHCLFHAIYCPADTPLVRPLLDLLHNRRVLIFPRRFGIFPWPRRVRLEQDVLERSEVVLLFWSEEAARDPEVCNMVNRAVHSGRRFTLVCLDDAAIPGLPPGTAEYPAKLRFLAGHQWYGWLDQFSKEIASALAAGCRARKDAIERRVRAELRPSGHSQS
jgi:hypothetical protein